jgi:GTP cyclohydrolase II
MTEHILKPGVEVPSCLLPTPWGVFALHGFIDPESGAEHVVLTLGEVGTGEPVLARIHSECLTGDALFSQRCDCGAQLEAALQKIAALGRGVLVYLRQEGRGIGLINKIRAYALQDTGADTVEANHQLGFPADLRSYRVCRAIFDHFGVHAPRLLTNNPAKPRALDELGILVEPVPLQAGRNHYNERYLATKAEKLGHLIS